MLLLVSLSRRLWYSLATSEQAEPYVHMYVVKTPKKDARKMINTVNEKSILLQLIMQNLHYSAEKLQHVTVICETEVPIPPKRRPLPKKKNIPQKSMRKI